MMLELVREQHMASKVPRTRFDQKLVFNMMRDSLLCNPKSVDFNLITIEIGNPESVCI